MFGNEITADTQNHSVDNLGRRKSTLINGVTTYRYNALGQRTEKAQGSTVRRFSYDLQGHLLGEYTASAQPVREYLYLDDTPIALLDYPTPTSSPVVYNILSDRLNTPREITNSSNITLWCWEGEPFGAQAPNEDVDGNGVAFSFNLRFPGQYFDSETGLNYNYYRDYDPATGRYIQSDPIGLAGGINTYGYVGGNPTGAVDPLGLFKTINCKPKQKKVIENACPIAQDKANIGGIGEDFSEVLDSTTFDCEPPPKLKGNCGVNFKGTIFLPDAFNEKACGPIESTIGHEVSHSPPFNYDEDNARIFEYGLFGGSPPTPEQLKDKYPNMPHSNYNDFYEQLIRW